MPLLCLRSVGEVLKFTMAAAHEIDVVCAVDHDLALFCADFHSISDHSVYQPAGGVLKFILAATDRCKSDVTSKL